MNDLDDRRTNAGADARNLRQRFAARNEVTDSLWVAAERIGCALIRRYLVSVGAFFSQKNSHLAQLRGNLSIGEQHRAILGRIGRSNGDDASISLMTRKFWAETMCFTGLRPG